MSEWQPIETAPKDGTEILGWWKRSKTMEVIVWCDIEHNWLDVQDVPTSAPTHWMPLPTPPESKEQT